MGLMNMNRRRANGVQARHRKGMQLPTENAHQNKRISTVVFTQLPPLRSKYGSEDISDSAGSTPAYGQVFDREEVLRQFREEPTETEVHRMNNKFVDIRWRDPKYAPGTVEGEMLRRRKPNEQAKFESTLDRPNMDRSRGGAPADQAPAKGAGKQMEVDNEPKMRLYGVQTLLRRKYTTGEEAMIARLTTARDKSHMFDQDDEDMQMQDSAGLLDMPDGALNDEPGSGKKGVRGTGYVMHVDLLTGKTREFRAEGKTKRAATSGLTKAAAKAGPQNRSMGKSVHILPDAAKKTTGPTLPRVTFQPAEATAKADKDGNGKKPVRPLAFLHEVRSAKLRQQGMTEEDADNLLKRASTLYGHRAPNSKTISTRATSSARYTSSAKSIPSSVLRSTRSSSALDSLPTMAHLTTNASAVSQDQSASLARMPSNMDFNPSPSSLPSPSPRIQRSLLDNRKTSHLFPKINWPGFTTTI